MDGCANVDSRIPFVVAPASPRGKAGVSRPVFFRLFRRWDLGRLLVMLALVAFIKLEFATLNIGVGNARKIRCE